MSRFSKSQISAVVALFVVLFSVPHTANAQKATDVNVINTPAIRQADRPEKQPFLDTLVSGSKTDFRVPIGKRLVIEYVSGTGFISSGQKFFATSVTYSAVVNGGGQAFVQATLSPALMGTRNTGTNLFDIYSISQATRLYVEPGGIVSIRLENGPAVAGFTLTVSGYLVDIP